MQRLEGFRRLERGLRRRGIKECASVSEKEVDVLVCKFPAIAERRSKGMLVSRFLELGGSVQQLGIGPWNLESMLLEHVRAIEKMLGVHHERNRHDVVPEADQHLVLDVVLVAVLFHETIQWHELSACLQEGDGTVRDGGRVER